VFWYVTPCGSCKNRTFRGSWRIFHIPTSTNILQYTVPRLCPPQGVTPHFHKGRCLVLPPLTTYHIRRKRYGTEEHISPRFSCRPLLIIVPPVFRINSSASLDKCNNPGPDAAAHWHVSNPWVQGVVPDSVLVLLRSQELVYVVLSWRYIHITCTVSWNTWLSGSQNETRNCGTEESQLILDLWHKLSKISKRISVFVAKLLL
jgi:hypothetical protein